MLENSSSRALLAAGALLTGAAFVYSKNAGRDGDDTSPLAVGAESGRATALTKSGTLRSLAADERARMEREIRAMSLRQLRDALPEDVKAMTLHPERTELLFRRFGALEGEEALHEIMRRYPGKGSFTANSMTSAVLGWMSVDRAGAVAAFKEMVSPSNFLISMQWKGTQILSGMG